MDKQLSKKAIAELIEKFKKVLDEGNASKYNEEMTKKDFILPLFRCLGWDIENSSEVSAEEKISKKRVDYSFRINGIPKFFLEAKSLREQLDKDNYRFYSQAVEYSWYKGCTWAVLTNFEHLRILNAEVKTTNPLQSQFRWIDYNEYLTRFDELWLLSKESFEQGLLDKEAERLLKKTKKGKVDEQLLADFTRFRETLSKNVAKLNQKMHLSEEELDESIQRILDRLIFIRNCEDRELEEKKLWEAKNEIRAWKKVKEIFSYYDIHYDSKLFTYDPSNPKNVHQCDKLDIDDSVIREILNGLYRAKDDFVSYDFSAIDADVLGTVYEQYLSHILKKTGKRAKLTENQSHRKEQGIYYTPVYIVDYIVRSTLGELLKQREADAEKIKVLDPACGSGSFLIKAFDILKEHYGSKDHKQTQLDLETGIPFKMKEKILKENIFGVDLDKQAVEIAQLNLLLKIAEGRFRLPLLEQNIQCGNSLIEDETIADSKAFKWDEKFRGIMKDGGFDVVIGNPPYVRVDSLREEDKSYWKGIFDSTKGKYDLYYLFIESIFRWLKDGGVCGFIVPNKFCAASSARRLREIIVTRSSSCNIISVSHLDVFKEAANYPVILILTKGKGIKKISMGSVKNQNDFLQKKFENYWLTKEDLDVLPQQIFPINITQDELNLVIKLLSNNERLLDYLKISEGLRIPESLEDEKPNDLEIVKQYQFSKWTPIDKGTFISKKNLESVAGTTSKRYNNILKDKLIIAEDALSISATFDFNRRAPQGGVYFGVATEKSVGESISLKYILGLLNSKLLSFVYSVLFGGMHMGGGYLRYRTEFLEQLPIKIAGDYERQKLTELADRMLSLHRDINRLGEKTTDERRKKEGDVKKTDAEIGELVNRLYGLNDREKEVVENRLK
jgi:type I restriction-modification system DNA methylase subunit